MYINDDSLFIMNGCILNFVLKGFFFRVIVHGTNMVFKFRMNFILVPNTYVGEFVYYTLIYLYYLSLPKKKKHSFPLNHAIISLVFFYHQQTYILYLQN